MLEFTLQCDLCSGLCVYMHAWGSSMAHFPPGSLLGSWKLGAFTQPAAIFLVPAPILGLKKKLTGSNGGKGAIV